MRLKYLFANQAYAFTFGDQIIALEGHPRFFLSRTDACRAAQDRGLTVNPDNTCQRSRS